MTRPLEKFFDEDVEPTAKCGNCEYYDGAGLKTDGTWMDKNGDCLHSGSPRFQTNVNDACKCFFPCSVRWPNADHGD